MAVILKGKNARKPRTVRYWVDGKQREKSFVTLAEARDFKAKVEHDVKAQIFIDPRNGSTPFGDYAEQWITRHPGAEGTKRTYRSALRKHIRPVLGDTPLSKITRDDVSSLLLDTITSPSIAKTAQTLLTSVLGEALKAGKVSGNVASGIRLPAATAERAAFTLATRGQLDSIADGLPAEWALAVWLMRGCGLRIGEALAIRADSVRGETLRAEEQVLDTGKLGPLKHRKPGQFRDVPLPRYVAARIQRHVERFGIAADGYLFPMFADGSVRSNRLRTAFTRERASAGLPDGFTPHDLRHTFASVALANGVPITDVSRWLGHRNINLTHRIYGHLVPETTTRARNILDQEFDSLR